MRTTRTATAVVFATLAAWLTLEVPYSAHAQAQPAGQGKGKGFAQDPRAQTRTYHFEDTNEDLPYSLYVSSKIKKGQKAPMIVTLHGLGAPQTIMMGAAAIDLAEEGGYILVSPMGYNISGWYGSPQFSGGPGRGKGKATPPPPGEGKGPASAPNAATNAAPNGAPPNPGGAGKGKGFGGIGGANQPANL